MALDDGHEDAGAGDGRSRTFGAGPLPLVLLAIVMVVLLWLLWQFVGQTRAGNETTGVTTTSTIDVGDRVVPEEPEVPVPAEASTRAEESRVPDVVGRTQSSALVALNNAGYDVDTIYVYSDSTPAGILIQQNPSADVTLPTGGVVGIIVSRGNPRAPQVEMPDIVGLTKSAAVAKVKAAGLRPYILYGTDQAYSGRVGNQWPLGGTRIPKGSEGFIQVMITK